MSKMGRPKGSRTDTAFRDLMRDHTEEAMKGVLKCLKSRNGMVVMRAAECIFDRAWGKPRQALEISKHVDYELIRAIVQAQDSAVADAEKDELDDAA